ncbi:hypothetical protein P355_5099 [Burkholderia cenocepacia KC-01]|nr:hypothetical protein P355_5099 [Burkholderia cenocepacia KC-01]
MEALQNAEVLADAVDGDSEKGDRNEDRDDEDPRGARMSALEEVGVIGEAAHEGLMTKAATAVPSALSLASTNVHTAAIVIATR